MPKIHFTKEDYYNLAIEYFNNIEQEHKELVLIIPKSISVVIDHEFIPTPCVEIKLGLFQDENEVGSYILYVDEQKQIIDEFLILQ